LIEVPGEQVLTHVSGRQHEHATHNLSAVFINYEPTGISSTYDRQPGRTLFGDWNFKFSRAPHGVLSGLRKAFLSVPRFVIGTGEDYDWDD
jgi:hypothetical protein